MPTEIIGNVDDDGYLQVSVEELAAQAGCDPGHIEKILAVVQDFDPPGVASRNLQECLLKQVDQLGMSEDLVGIILRDHLEELENRRYQVIARSLQVPLDEVFGAAKFISAWTPVRAVNTARKTSITSFPISLSIKSAMSTSSFSMMKVYPTYASIPFIATPCPDLHSLMKKPVSIFRKNCVVHSG